MSAEHLSPGVEQAIVEPEVYHLLKATTAKLEGLAAYDKYDLDDPANRQLWGELRQQDEEAVRRLLAQLLQVLQRFAQEGRLRAD